jgi:hypothetical protein
MDYCRDNAWSHPNQDDTRQDEPRRVADVPIFRGRIDPGLGLKRFLHIPFLPSVDTGIPPINWAARGLRGGRVTGYVEPVSHEFAVNYLFDAKGLAPFFAADSQVKPGGGSHRSVFHDQGERWTATLYYQDSNIVHPGSRLPDRYRVAPRRDARVPAESRATRRGRSYR